MSQSSQHQNRSRALVFGQWNYVLLLIGVALIMVGFTAMYLEGEYLGFISLNVAPVLIIGGYAEIMYALLWASDEHSLVEDQ